MDMPLVKTISPCLDCNIHLWILDEQEDFFVNAMAWDAKQLIWLQSLHPVKRLEYMASRYLIYRFAGIEEEHLYKDEAGKLYLRKSQHHVSVSHSNPWIGISLARVNIGFDLQVYKPKIETIAKRFLSEGERRILFTLKLLTQEDLCLCWAAKEAIYKHHGKKGIDFAQQIRLDFSMEEAGHVSIHAILQTSELTNNYHIHYEKNKDFVWALAVGV